MNKPKSQLKNETHEMFWYFDIQTDHVIPAKRSDQVLLKKMRTCRLVNFVFPVDHRWKIKASNK